MTTKERSVAHSTFSIEKEYAVPLEKVFAAFSDPKKKRRWFADGEEAKVEAYIIEFREGGHEHVSFRSKEGHVFTNETTYQDIVLGQRIVFAYTMSMNGKRISSSQSTVELMPSKRGTQMIYTEQAAFFEGSDGPKIRKQGWSLLFDRLGKELAKWQVEDLP
jgi:uncharacterized protein YndB with AHSA1/START domain